jgi:hypothetical protein
MIMRLRFGVGLITVLVLGLALAGCGGGSSSSTTTTPPPAVVLKSIAVSGPTTAISGQTGLQYKATGTYSDGSSKDLTSTATWSSSVQSVATVSSSGSATAVAGGVAQGGIHQTVTIIATSGSIKGAAALTVSDDLTSVAVTPSTPTITASAQQQFTATGTFQDDSSKQIDSSVTWNSSPSSTATINSSGLATGVAAGGATISAKCPCGTLVTAANLIPGAASLTVTAAGAGGLTSITVTAASPTLVVGATQNQLTATGTYASGPNQNITNSVTWSKTSTTNGADGSVSSTGGALGTTSGPAQNGTITLQATLGTISGSIILPVVPVLNTMTITTPGPGMIVGGNQFQFRVKGLYNDNTSNDVTSLAAWTDQKSDSVVTFTNTGTAGLASPVGAGQDTVTATIKNAFGANVSSSTGVNVVASTNGSSTLKDGGYAFTLLGANSTGPVFYAGSFVASGGNITSGVIDENAAGVVTNLPSLSGGYSTSPDGRGTLTFNQSAMFNTPGGISFRFILSSNGSLGKLIEFDNLGTLKGTLWQQSGSITDALNGNYVFRAAGIDSSANPYGEAGFFNTTGTGNITTGTVDIDDFGTDSVATSLCPGGTGCSISAIKQSGRGTMTLVQGGTTTNYAFYVVTAATETHPLMNFIETDNNGAGGAAVAGTMALQVGATGGYTASTLESSGPGYAFLLDRPVASGSCESQCNVTEFAQVGEFTYTESTTNTGTLVGVRDDTNPPGTNPFNVTGGYDLGGVGTPVGRGVITTLGSDSNRGYTFYMVSPTQAYVLQNYTGYNSIPPVASLNAPVGEMDAQTGPFTITTLVGEYGLDASDVGTPGLTTDLMWLFFDGTGNISGIVDSSVGSPGASATTISSSIITSVTYTLPNANAGRVLLSVTTQNGQTATFVLYLTSAQNALVLSVAPSTGITPVMDGSLNQQ